MKTNLMKIIGSATFGLALLVGLGMTPGNSVQAQYPNDQYRRDQDRDRDRGGDWDRDRRGRNDRGRGRSGDDYPNWGGSFQLRQTALNAGYNEGIKQGRNDLSHRRRFDYQRQGAYQKATKDYNSRDGNRELYRRYFREAYENGYQAGYRGY